MSSKEMNAQIIENTLNELSVDSIGRIRGKQKANNKILSQHLTEIDNKLMDIRVFVARISTRYSSKEALKMIDGFNPQVAARSSSAFALINHLDSQRQDGMKKALNKIMEGKPSRDTFEVVSKYLAQ